MDIVQTEEGVLQSFMTKRGLMTLVALAGGSALGGSFATGEPVRTVLTSLQGSGGVMLGYVAGTMAMSALYNFKLGKDGRPEDSTPGWVYYLPWIGAVAVPLITGGTFDRGLVGLLAGAKIATVFV